MMTNRIYRIAIVGAASLAGKELGDALSDSSFAAASFILLDDEKATGQISSAGDEISFIQPVDANSFDAIDLVFFVGDPDVATKYAKAARQAGAGVIDLTFALEQEAGVLVRSPWVAAVEAQTTAVELDLGTSAVVPAHPAAAMLALVTARIATKFEVARVSATVLEPASQYGRAAMDELHQQTVSLLSFQKLPRETYDAQVAFNLLQAMGEESKVRLADSAARIERHFRSLLGDRPELALQLVHAPVFHGYVLSIFIELTQPATLEAVELSLVGDHIDLLAPGSEPPSNLSATGQDEIMISMQSANAAAEHGTRFKLLVAADNLKLAAIHAIACARELAQFRPSGKVQ